MSQPVKARTRGVTLSPGRSIDVKLLIVVTGLLLATVSAFSWLAFRRVEEMALVAAGERLRNSTTPIVQLLQTAMTNGRRDLQRLATDSGLRTFLLTGRMRDEAQGIVARRGPDTAAVRVELRDRDGRMLLWSGSSQVPNASPWIERGIANGTVSPGQVDIGPILAIDSTSYTETLTAIASAPPVSPGGDRQAPPAEVIGYLAEVRRISTQGAQTIRALIGEEATLLIGVPGDSIWTDLAGPVPPPPEGATAGESLVFESSPRGAGVGYGATIAGTPWMLWAQQPRHVALASTRGLIGDLSLLALLFIVAGAVSAMVLSRRITRPLVQLTEAAEHLATTEGLPERPSAEPLDEVGRLSDAFERMQARVHDSYEAVLASERRFRALLEHAADPIVVLDTHGVVRYASPAYSRLLDITPEELAAQPLVDRIHDDDRVRAEATLAGVQRDATHPLPMRARFRRTDGNWRTLHGSASNLLAEDSINGIVLNLRDVTEQVALEGQLRHAQKMEAVGRLAGGVAHDINNILTAITAFSQFALGELPPDTRAREDIEQVDLAAQRAAAMTRQLLAFSRQQVQQPRPVNLNDVVQHVERLLRRLLRADVELHVHAAPELGQVLADRSQMEQVVMNLVLNARDAMPNGGTITIETSQVQLGSDYVRQHPEVEPGPHIVLSITDTGFGMDEATVARIFEPYFTTKAVGSGTGLGLSTVYGIVKQSGGSIWVYSEVGRGTVFKVFLPLLAGGALPEAPPAPPVVHPVREARILLVEDDEAVRRVATRVLENAGFTVLVATNGHEALRHAEESAAPIDLMLTDVVMPDIGGRELARQVAARWPHIAIIFMSGYTAEAMNRQAVLERDVAFIEKPFAPGALAAKVRQVLRGEPLQSHTDAGGSSGERRTG